MTTAYADAGLRWAFQALHVRNEVVGVMEEMLATIEVRFCSRVWECEASRLGSGERR